MFKQMGMAQFVFKNVTLGGIKSVPINSIAYNYINRVRDTFGGFPYQKWEFDKKVGSLKVVVTLWCKKNTST